MKLWNYEILPLKRLLWAISILLIFKDASIIALRLFPSSLEHFQNFLSWLILAWLCKLKLHLDQLPLRTWSFDPHYSLDLLSANFFYIFLYFPGNSFSYSQSYSMARVNPPVNLEANPLANPPNPAVNCALLLPAPSTSDITNNRLDLNFQNFYWQILPFHYAWDGSSQHVLYCWWHCNSPQSCDRPTML